VEILTPATARNADGFDVPGVERRRVECHPEFTRNELSTPRENLPVTTTFVALDALNRGKRNAISMSDHRGHRFARSVVDPEGPRGHAPLPPNS